MSGLGYGEQQADDIRVEFDGKPPLFFPKDTPREEIDRVARNYHLGLFKAPAAPGAQPAPQAPGFMDKVDRAAKVVGSGVNSMVSNIVGLPRTMADAARTSPGMQLAVDGALQKLPEPFRAAAMAERDRLNAPGATDGLPSTEGVGKTLEPVLPRVKPEGAVERMLHGFGANAFPHPAAMIPAVGAALGGEGLRQGANAIGLPQYADTAEGIGHIAGSFGAISAQRALVPTAHEMVRDAARGVTPAQWAEAQRIQDDARRLGVPLLGPESVAASSLRRLGADTRAHPTGGVPMEGFLANRPQQLAGAAERAAGTLGPQQDPAKIAQAVQQAAEGVLARAQANLSKQASPLYAQAEATRVPDADVAYLVNLIRSRAMNTSEDAARELYSLAQRLEANPTVGAISAEVKSLRDAGSTAGTMQATDRSQAAKTATARIESTDPMTGQRGPLVQAEQTLEAVSPSYAAAQDVYRRLGPEVAAQRSGPLGQLATRNPDELGNVATTIKRQEQILAGTENATPASIRGVARELNNVNPAAFRDFVAEYLRRSWDTASRDMQSGANLMAGANWRKALYGSDRARANVRTLIEESAAATGQNPSGVVAGFDRLMDVMERTGTIPNIGSPTAARASNYARAAEGDVKGSLLGIQLVDPLAPLRRWRQRVFQEGQFTELGNLFARPDSVAALKQLAMTGPGTRREQMLIATLLGSTSQADQLREDQ